MVSSGVLEETTMSTPSLRFAARAMKAMSPVLSALTGPAKNAALVLMAQALRDHAAAIAEANQKDLEEAEVVGLEKPLMARLKFQGEKIEGAAQGLEALSRLADPVGRTLSARELDAGLELFQVTCPLGVVAMIFESRPDALVQMAGLALKSGNAVILKGGSEAKHSNRVLADLVHAAGVKGGLPKGWLFLAETREDVKTILELNDAVDLVIPRGSNEFVQYIMKNTTIPVLGHADGLCHIYVDGNGEVEKAIPLIVDSKTQYVAVCNAVETLLVHRDIAPYLLPPLRMALEARAVELRGDAETRKFLPGIVEAVEEDWETEYLDLILSIKVVGSLDEAITHINTYGSKHTDAIVTESRDAAEKFMNDVDSANVFWNASTRFADGFRYGLGAEVGVSTAKIHARGPVGLDGLVIYKYKLYGKGQIVAPYAGSTPKPFTHKELPLDGGHR
jgi:glutamate-5-semialdehyde dehydrogenase